ncbi:MAG TPA: AAA family ATPase [Phycisphaerae bacterium]|nr:AAA family ATPase [Phycisphaerae bacterium]
MPDTERLLSLLTAEYPCIRISTPEEEEARQLVAAAFLSRGKSLWRWSASDGITDGQLIDDRPVPNTEHLAAACVYLRGQRWQAGQGALLLDAAPNLCDPRTMRELRDLLYTLEKARAHLLLIDSAELPELLRNLATPFDLSLPDAPEIEHCVRELLRSRMDDLGLQIDINRHDFDIILRNLRGLTRRQIRQVILDTITGDHRFNADDLNHVLASKRRCLAGADGLLEYIEAPTHIDDIGGMTNLKSWLARRQEALADNATQFGLTPPRGIFLLGVQGAGKSLAAKAVATAWARPLLRLDPSVLFDRFIGESERRLNSALLQAEAMAPIVLWIDEIEKGFASAASQSVDGGLSKRMFGTLLTWMQEHTAPVFLVATANDIESLPPELLRKGRFDEIFFVDLPIADARAQIFRIHLAKRKRDPQKFDIPDLVKASEGYSGSEIEQAVIAALFDAFSAKTDLTTDLLLSALKKSPPLSVTMAEKIDDLRSWSQGRCVPADNLPAPTTPPF